MAPIFRRGNGWRKKLPRRLEVIRYESPRRIHARLRKFWHVISLVLLTELNNKQLFVLLEDWKEEGQLNSIKYMYNMDRQMPSPKRNYNTQKKRIMADIQGRKLVPLSFLRLLIGYYYPPFFCLYFHFILITNHYHKTLFLFEMLLNWSGWKPPAHLWKFGP